MKTPIIEQEWEEFWKAVKPQNAPEVQRLEMRRAFFAGMHSLLTKIASLFDSEDSEPTAEDLVLMEKIHQELLAFQKAMSEGGA